MTRREEDREPDYVGHRVTRVRFGEALLVEGVLCALAVSLLVLVPAIAAEAPQASPNLQATYRVCTPVALLDDEDTAVEPATTIAPQPPCAAPAPMRLVKEISRPDGGEDRWLP
ncbi:hypothetical protein [Ancylobacter sp. G4_0304]|uniref:hypothetical protein n=1 Tax=Ancylobacter sp. G4_0304 TaxID=3114289 RepID=UPI0039C6A41E